MRLYERESMWTFQREVSKFHEYQDYQGVDLLALMQHYECKTRLLDFTMAPLTALYMALDQNETDYAKVENYAACHCVSTHLDAVVERPDFALWAVDLIALCSKDSSVRKSCDEDFEGHTVEKFYEDAGQVLANPVRREHAGVLPVFPRRCNVRISAQDGLFLMPKCLDCSFEDNLRCCVELPNRPPTKISQISGDEQIYKFVFASSLLAEVREVLLTANVTAKTVYPDLIGLGRFTAQEMRRHADDQRIYRGR